MNIFKKTAIVASLALSVLGAAAYQPAAHAAAHQHAPHQHAPHQHAAHQHAPHQHAADVFALDGVTRSTSHHGVSSDAYAGLAPGAIHCHLHLYMM